MTLKVGPEQKIFYPHMDLLCNASPFFEFAFPGQFKKASDAVIEIPEDGVEAVEDCLKWMYTGECQYSDIPCLWASGKSKTEYMRSVELYGFAEKLSCTALKQHLIDNFFAALGAHILGCVTSMPCVRRGYELTPVRSGLLGLFVASDAFGTSKSRFDCPQHISQLAETRSFGENCPCTTQVEVTNISWPGSARKSVGRCRY